MVKINEKRNYIYYKKKKRKLNSLKSEKKRSRLTRERVWAEDKREKFHSADLSLPYFAKGK